MEKQEFYKFIGRLVIFIHGLFVLLCSKDIINLVIGVIGSLLIFLLIPKIVIFFFNNSFFDVKDDAYRFEHRGRKVIAIFFSLSILGCFSYTEISQIFDFIIHNIYIDFGDSISYALFMSVGLSLVKFVCQD
ncbi:MAG: hypothetical protein Q4Q31_11700 [Bacillota bacterium]|nr:hypothetical protein [Bacillota bacterium]